MSAPTPIQLMTPSAGTLLRGLVREERHGIKSKTISYGDERDNQDALDDLELLEVLAETIIEEGRA